MFPTKSKLSDGGKDSSSEMEIELELFASDYDDASIFGGESIAGSHRRIRCCGNRIVDVKNRRLLASPTHSMSVMSMSDIEEEDQHPNDDGSFQLVRRRSGVLSGISTPVVKTSTTLDERRVAVVAPYQHESVEKGIYYKCNLCRKCFVAASGLKRHFARRHHKYEAVNAPPPRSLLPKNQCRVCRRRFSRHEVLKTHMFVHGDEARLICGICGYRMHNPREFVSHMFDHSQPRKPYFCQCCCGRSFQCRHVTAHLRNIATYKCHMCRRFFTSRAVLDDHVRDHFTMRYGGQSYPCEYCGSEFSREGLLETHMYLHEQSSFEEDGDTLVYEEEDVVEDDDVGKTHRCRVCDKGFYQKGYLEMHMAQYHPSDYLP